MVPTQKFYTILYDPWHVDDIVAARVWAYKVGWKNARLVPVGQLDKVDGKVTTNKPWVCVSELVQGVPAGTKMVRPISGVSRTLTVWGELYSSCDVPPLVCAVDTVTNGRRDAPCELACDALWLSWSEYDLEEDHATWDDLLGMTWGSSGAYQDLVSLGFDSDSLLSSSRTVVMPFGTHVEVGYEGDTAYAVNLYRPGYQVFVDPLVDYCDLGLAYCVQGLNTLFTLYSLDGGETNAGEIARMHGGKGTPLVGEWLNQVNVRLWY